MKFQNICLYETVKVAVSVRVISSYVRWRRIFHESLHVLREMITNKLDNKNDIQKALDCKAPLFNSILKIGPT